MWLARGSRIDLAAAVRKLLQRATSWTRMEDYLLWRVMCYLHTFPNLGLQYTYKKGELEGLVISQRCDADLAGDAFDAKSTTGFHSGLKGARKTSIILDWASRKQTATARNTPDAELTALDEASHTSGLVIQEIFENLLKRPIRLIAETDNDTAVSVVAKGYSRRLCYLRRTQRISISALHDLYHGEGDDEELEPSDEKTLNRLLHSSGDAMTADILTKLLEPAPHWRHMDALGYVVVPPEWERQ